MAELEPLFLSSEDLLRLRKREIGYGTEGAVFDCKNGELVKLYHKKIMAIAEAISKNDEEVKIYQKGSLNSRVIEEPLTAYFYNAENKEFLKLQSKHAIKYAIEKQKNISRTKLPKNIVYVENIYAGCLLDKIIGVQIHKLSGLPLKRRRIIMLEVLKSVRELLDNNVYHLELDNSPFSKLSTNIPGYEGKTHYGHSHVLVDLKMRPHLIDLEGKTTVYTERRNEMYEALCFESLCGLLIDFFLKIDAEKSQDKEFEQECLAYYLEQAQVKEKYISGLSEYSLNIDEIEDVVKTLPSR